MGTNIGKTISKNLSGKYSPGMLAICKKLLDYAEKSATYALKTFSKRVIQKRAGATGDLIGRKIDKRITKVSEKSKQNNSVRQLQMIMIKKYLKKNIYLQKKNTNSLII